MTTPRVYTRFALFFVAITAASAPGCALLSKGHQGNPRFFSIERAIVRPAPDSAMAVVAPHVPVKLRLGSVTGALHLEERLVFRDTPHELGYYRERRWTEPPEVFLKRMLAQVLFEERGVEDVAGGGGPTLEVQLTALDEIRAPRHLARAQVIARLHEENLVLWEETLTVDISIVDEVGGDPVVATVDALGEAMRAVVDQIADRVVRALEAPR